MLPVHVLASDCCQSVSIAGTGIHACVAAPGLAMSSRVVTSNVRHAPATGV